MSGSIGSAPVRPLLTAASLLLMMAAAAVGRAGEHGHHRHSFDEQNEQRAQQLAAPATPAPAVAQAAPAAAVQAPAPAQPSAQFSGGDPGGGGSSSRTIAASSGSPKAAAGDNGDSDRSADRATTSGPAAPNGGPAAPDATRAAQANPPDGSSNSHSGAATDIPEEKPHRTFSDWLQDHTGVTMPIPKGTSSYIPPPPVPGALPAAEPAKPKAPVADSKPAPARAPSGRVLNPPLEVIAPEILAPNLSRAALQQAVALGFKANGKVGLTGSGGGMTRLLAPPGMSADAARALLRETLPGQDLGVNQIYRIYTTAAEPGDASPPVPMPTPCGTDRCFGSNLIGWRPVLQACARKVRIGVIDTAFDGSHPTFHRRQIEVRPPPQAREQAGRTEAPNWHGTGVLAILAGEPQSGTPGLIPDGRFLAADVFFADAGGLPVSDTASLIEALDWLEQKRVDIVNMSLTGPHDDLLQAAIVRMSKRGVLFVAAVGNDGPGAPPTYPSAYPQVLAVTAINKDLSSYRFANRGDHVDLAAPGVGIWTALPGGRGTYHSGTSFAVPYATAVVASVYGSLAVKSKEEVLRHMNFVDLGAPGRDPIYGNGLVIAPYACAPEREEAPKAAPGGEVAAGTAGPR